MEQFGLDYGEEGGGIDPGPIEELDKSILKLKHCIFCGSDFQQPGSLGRHLDRKKGDNLHPSDKIDLLRQNVTRRKKPSSSDDDLVKQVNKRIKKQEIAKKYNLKDEVREKNKIRRKMRDRQIKSRLSVLEDFQNQFGDLSDISNFAHFVCMFLPVGQWPDTPPDGNLRDTVVDGVKKYHHPLLTEDKVDEAYERWQKIPQDMKITVWQQERKQSLDQTLKNVTLYDILNRKEIFGLQQQKLLEDYSKEDYIDYDFNDLDDFNEVN